MEVGMYGRKWRECLSALNNYKMRLARDLLNLDDNNDLMLVQRFGIGLIQYFSKLERLMPIGCVHDVALVVF